MIRQISIWVVALVMAVVSHSWAQGADWHGGEYRLYQKGGGASLACGHNPLGGDIGWLAAGDKGNY